MEETEQSEHNDSEQEREEHSKEKKLPKSKIIHEEVKGPK